MAFRGRLGKPRTTGDGFVVEFGDDEIEPAVGFSAGGDRARQQRAMQVQEVMAMMMTRSGTATPMAICTPTDMPPPPPPPPDSWLLVPWLKDPDSEGSPRSSLVAEAPPVDAGLVAGTKFCRPVVVRTAGVVWTSGF